MFDDQRFHIVPSVRDLKYLEQALATDEEWILLSGVHIGNLKSMVNICHNRGKKVLVNHEIIGGLGSDKTAFRLLKQMFEVDGVMGSSGSKLSAIKKEGIPAIRRIALYDTMTVDQTLKGLNDVKCGIIELRPSYYAVKFLKQFQEACPCIYAAGGFIDSEEMVDRIYQAGFHAAMTSCVKLWGYHPREITSCKIGKEKEKKLGV